MASSRAFQKCKVFHFLTNFFCKHFYYITGFCDKIFYFCKFANFLQSLKVEHKSFPMMYHLSYLDIKHGISRGGGVKLTPQHILVFKYPSRDRVNIYPGVKDILNCLLTYIQVSRIL